MNLSEFPSHSSIEKLCFSEKLEVLLLEWQETERVLKIAEIATKEAINPAIWELRYSGRRIVDALLAFKNSEPESKVISYLDDAIFDCFRSRHDAIDATTAFISKRLDLISTYFDNKILHIMFPNYLELYDIIISIRSDAIASRVNRNDRDAIYKTIASDRFVKCCSLYQDLERMIVIVRPQEKNSRLRIAALDSLTLIVPLSAVTVAGYYAFPSITNLFLSSIGFVFTVLGALYGWLALKLEPRD